METQSLKLQDIIDELRLIELAKQNPRDQLYLLELQILLDNNLDIQNTFMELTYILARYEDPDIHISEINPFLIDSSNIVSHYITAVRFCYSMHLYIQLETSLNMSVEILNQVCETKRIPESSLISIFSQTRPEGKETHDLVDEGSSNMYIFANYICKGLKILSNLNLIESDKNFLFAVSMYFGFFKKEDETM